MAYRDELEAAQRRIQDLESQVHDLKHPNPPDRAPPRRTDGPGPGPETEAAASKGAGCVLFGIPVGLLLVVGFFVAGFPLIARACGASGGETDAALGALRRCSAAREQLGEDVDWAAVGCANCESESGGDPINGGCHSNSSWQMPVSGSRGRGSYQFGFSALPGKKQEFNGGSVSLANGGRLSIPATGSACALSGP